MTDRYAVIGNPIVQSLSPDIHANFARQFGHVMTYTRLLAPLDGFREMVETYRLAGASGVNVTMPFKVEAFEYATSPSARATAAGAANTLHFLDDEIIADNTDGVGLTRDIRQNLQRTIAGKRVLLIGAGGAARGVVGALLDEEPASLIVTNRSHEKAFALVASQVSPANIVFIAAAMTELHGHQFDIVINATAASLQKASLNLAPELFADGCLAYDMVYGKGETAFMAEARHAGAQTADGLGMLVEQAAEAFYVWRGVMPKTKDVIATIRNGLSTT
jgi:shikimate dehydrogenase